jgi:hypothetical protein
MNCSVQTDRQTAVVVTNWLANWIKKKAMNLTSSSTAISTSAG